MNTRHLAFALAFIVTTAVVAEPPVRRTIVVRDGQVISDDVVTPGEAFGKRPYLGVVLTDITAELREHFGAPKDSGVLVGSLDDDGPAAKAGVRVGDIILSIDGKSVESAGDVRRALREKKAGDSARVEVLRGKSRQTIVATVTEREGMRMMLPRDVEMLVPRDGEWHGRIERFSGDCGELKTRINELESRLKDLEKKLQK